jgi:hypothetical protein
MPTIKLRVTQAVVSRVNAGHTGEQQIAYRTDSPEIRQRLAQVRRHQRVNAEIGGSLGLVVGDTGAIWRSHNADRHAADFDWLYEFLAHRPGTELEFTCRIE